MNAATIASLPAAVREIAASIVDARTEEGRALLRAADALEISTPFIDRATVARFVVEDFDLTEQELVAISDPAVRYTLEDALREVADFDELAARALDHWRKKRGRP
jgi:hypothetical protein